MKGRLIVFEGVEGCGKTTQLQRSHQWLKSSLSVIVTREPGGTHLGSELRQLLLTTPKQPICNSTELLLYAADRAQHVEEVLKPELANGMMILCDRYVDSTMAYQGYGRGLSRSLIEQLNNIATGGLESDLTLWLDIDVTVSLARKQQGASGGDRIEQEKIDFHRRVQQGYTELAQANPQRIVRIDASCNEAEVQKQIQQILLQRFPEIKNQG
ncbi:dTMP kinase [Gloeocapsopsis dulcis]|uniref:Thymidylate kinase n=1 Tax=Gloeocapsopsis dulcis AAB1 = 1H9 TaxID=1433147 RepID=A0A6N8FY51_9CHRO|nr:dTMP kinase [Gloeocapsopsis dulcis]MUL38070.1 dTMP kinase [Gloeocapsopsis dulcis AAB1 = 1H9]WNN91758.1 dTMP kinase [Gloeocapsopsis dulcis]